jgi:hypothetical protein
VVTRRHDERRCGSGAAAKDLDDTRDVLVLLINTVEIVVARLGPIQVRDPARRRPERKMLAFVHEARKMRIRELDNGEEWLTQRAGMRLDVSHQEAFRRTHVDVCCRIEFGPGDHLGHIQVPQPEPQVGEGRILRGPVRCVVAARPRIVEQQRPRMQGLSAFMRTHPIQQNRSGNDRA